MLLRTDAKTPTLVDRLRGSNLHRGLKKGVDALLGQVGYRLKRIDQLRPVDLRGESDDPRLFAYRGGRRPVVIDMPLKRGIGLDVFPLADTRRHPFASAARHALDSARPKQRIRDTMKTYYEAVQPATAAEWLGFQPDHIPPLSEQPPWARVLPWDGADITTRRDRVQSLSPIESQNAGERLTIAAHGWKTYGPVSTQLLDVEAERLYQLLASIREHGYLRDDSEIGDITATVLWKSETEWKWKIDGGDHRASVLSALGCRRVPVRLIKLIRPEDVDIWPNVASGLYDRQRALELFERLLADELPPVTHRWCHR